jgi:hypothetical protein
VSLIDKLRDGAFETFDALHSEARSVAASSAEVSAAARL